MISHNLGDRLITSVKRVNALEEEEGRGVGRVGRGCGGTSDGQSGVPAMHTEQIDWKSLMCAQ